MSEKLVSEEQLTLKEYEELYPNALQANKELRRKVIEKDAKIKLLEARGDAAPLYLTVGVSRDLSKIRLYDASKVLGGTYLCFANKFNPWYVKVMTGKGHSSEDLKVPYFKFIKHAEGFGMK